MAVFNTGMEIPHKSFVAKEAHHLRTSMDQVCQWLIQENPLWFWRERKAWSEGVFPSAEYKYLNNGTVKYKGQESVTEFSRAPGYLPGICGGHALLHTGYSSGTGWALKQRRLPSLSCVQTEATLWLWCPPMGVGQWVNSVGVSDASLGRREVKIEGAVVSFLGGKRTEMGIIGPHQITHFQSDGYICQT